MHRTLAQRVVYDLLRVLARLVVVWFGRFRVAGRENWPESGGALVCANHQSYLDPPLVGLTCPRRLTYLGRQTLFGNKLLAPIITFLDTIPIDREGGGLAGLKETLRRLKRGDMVLIFPEGTRTRNGALQSLKPGFCAVARRSGVPLVPVALDGAYDAWPRTSPLPRGGRLAVVIGKPISAAKVAQLSDEQLVAELARRMEECLAEARKLRGITASAAPGVPLQVVPLPSRRRDAS
ncbi:MAG TPA: lysophospholipid acyltransferase family protein [Pirellulaceae bacterium]|nr:lysophospholipid acyltransferase family protein [Pirellulaceae bacterium]